MPGPITIPNGGTAIKDPADATVYLFDWDDTNLPVGTTITTSTFAITGLNGDITTTPMTKDNESLITGNRKTQLRISAGALGSKWQVDNRIVTNESPTQTKERSFYVVVEQL